MSLDRVKSRRDFLKKGAFLAGAGVAGATLMGGLDRSIVAAPPPGATAYINQWNQILPASVMVWADSGGSYYVKDTGIGSEPGELVVNANVITAYGASLGAGTAGASTTTAGIQEAVNSLAAGGVIHIKAGIYNVSTPITMPWGLSFTFIGDGIPSLPKFVGPGPSFTTPSDGTQIRGTAAGFNSAGTSIGIFTRTAGSGPQATVTVSGIAVMPAWGTTSSGTSVKCFYETGNGTLFYRFGDVLFMPWGWSEAGTPTPSTSNDFNDLFLQLGGSGTQIQAWSLKSWGMRGFNSLYQADSVNIAQLMLIVCRTGPQVQAFDGLVMEELIGFNVNGVYATLTASTQQGALNHIKKIFVEQSISMGNYVVSISHTQAILKVDQVVIWTGGGSISPLTVTNVDSTQLLYPCYWWPGTSGTEQYLVFPMASEPTTTAFGDTIASPLQNTNNTIGSSGNTASITSGKTYKANLPVDVTIGAGTSQTITTKDAFGNVIDNAVATLTHRLLLPNYTITVTHSGAGSLTVVQATIGNFGTFAGTTATAQVGVNYLVLRRCLITNTISTGTMTTLDGSTNTGGNTMDSGLAVPIVRYLLEAGQIVQFGTAAPVAGTSCAVVQQ